MRPSIAIVDSDPTARQSLRQLLGTLAVEVQTFDNAEAYLAHRIGSKVPTCLIVDVTLSGMSGVQLLKHVRVTDAQLPVILLASESDVSVAVEAMRHGATDFIEKPQMDVALLRRVSQLVRNGSDVRAQTKTVQG
jgi:FixJ family two-component response regulator